MTNALRDHPLHVAIPETSGVTGVVMVEQVKSIDFRARGMRHIAPAPPSVIEEVLAVLDACIY